MTEIDSRFLPLGRREAGLLATAEFVLAARRMYFVSQRDGLEWIRHQFVHDAAPQSTVRVRSLLDGSVKVELTLTSAMQAKKLLQTGLIRDEGTWKALEQAPFRDAGRKHARLQDVETVVRTITIHMLSRAGGGARTFLMASALYCEWERERDGLSQDHQWEWQRHREALRVIEREFGPLGRVSENTAA